MANLTPKDTWNPKALGSHPLFWPLLPSAPVFFESFLDWPDLADYQHYLNNSEQPILVNSAHSLTVVPQAMRQSSFEDGYEQRIYLKGELQTRTSSWHDFFQVLVWKIFPRTKARLNELHYRALKSRFDSSRSKQRSVLENTLTQYDECGAVIVSPDQKLLDLVTQFDWLTLFWEQRELIEQNFKCIIFGHAIYEKGISPYVGMTAHSVLLQVPDTVFHSPTDQLLAYLDPQLEQQFTNNLIQTPQDLSPFPLLGMPGWHPENSEKGFYENTSYFRPGRKLKN